ncbi:hypothetical protein V6N12_036461 [Hibiscus sabdariffa]|uniref:Endonuclease/exonuclease/phosphatase domain-containing protein n=1 Tax=Hibiscus sabdariffa TaxID=183260 RepID=A0ABR2ER67_9ROSI
MVCLYSPGTLEGQVSLWNDITYVIQDGSLPWSIGGDFNRVPTMEERQAGCFDHASIHLTIDERDWVPNPFLSLTRGWMALRMFRVWVRNAESSLRFFKQVMFYQKFRAMRQFLCDWNKREFGSIDCQIESTQLVLDDLDTWVARGEVGDADRGEHRKLVADLWRLNRLRVIVETKIKSIMVAPRNYRLSKLQELKGQWVQDSWLCEMVCLYSPGTLEGQVSLWNDITYVIQDGSLPWSIGGDFNRVPTMEERQAGCFDHASIHLTIDERDWVPNPFLSLTRGWMALRMFRVWVRNAESSLRFFKQVMFYQKFRAMRQFLCDWNKREFGSIDCQIESTQLVLDDLDTWVARGEVGDADRGEHRKLVADLWRLNRLRVIVETKIKSIMVAPRNYRLSKLQELKGQWVQDSWLCEMVCLYSPGTLEGQVSLWNDITYVIQDGSLPWSIGGDFNRVPTMEERQAGCFDHASIHLTIDERDWVPNPFLSLTRGWMALRMFRVWVRNAESSLRFFKQVMFYQKFRAMRQFLCDWNKREFGSIDCQIESTQLVLDDLDTWVARGEVGDADRGEHRKLVADLWRLNRLRVIVETKIKSIMVAPRNYRLSKLQELKGQWVQDSWLCEMVCLYSPGTLEGQVSLWNDITYVIQDGSLPWSIGGDFNRVPTMEERQAGCFDHASIHLTIDERDWVPNPFLSLTRGWMALRMFRVWVRNAESSLRFFKQVMFYQKFRAMRQFLCDWNKREFGSIDCQIESTQLVLDDLDTWVARGEVGDADRGEHRKLVADLWRLNRLRVIVETKIKSIMVAPRNYRLSKLQEVFFRSGGDEDTTRNSKMDLTKDLLSLDSYENVKVQVCNYLQESTVITSPQVLYDYGIITAIHPMPFDHYGRNFGHHSGKAEVSISVPPNPGRNTSCMLNSTIVLSANDDRTFEFLPCLEVVNETKGTKWTYSKHFMGIPETKNTIYWVICWNFKGGELEAGDRISIRVVSDLCVLEFGVDLVYDHELDDRPNSFHLLPGMNKCCNYLLGTFIYILAATRTSLYRMQYLDKY